MSMNASTLDVNLRAVRQSFTWSSTYITGGGCVIPFEDSPRGTDCSALEGVADVGCDKGACKVSRCRVGYHPVADGTLCAPNN